MRFEQPESEQAYGPFALLHTSSPQETLFLSRIALATADKPFYDQIESTRQHDGTAVVMRAFVEYAVDRVEQNSLLRNIAFGVSKRRARNVVAEIEQLSADQLR